MTYVGKKLRMGRIFQKDGRSLIVAMDHGLGDGPMKGLEDPSKVLRKLIEGGADAVLTSRGVVNNYFDILAGNLGIILSVAGYESFNVKEAATLGMDALKLYYYVKNLAFGNLGDVPTLELLVAESEKWGMPLMVEIVPADLANVKVASRIAAEFGADFIKTKYTGTIESFREVIQTCPVPVVVLGGEKMGTDHEVLQTVWESIQAGGHGIAIGRNIWQRDDIVEMVKALRMIIHESATVNQAEKILKK